MATEGEDPEYVSDAEESPLPITMRRREASDDEEGNGEDRPRHDPRVRVHSDGESDGQGGVQTYEDEESEVEEEEEEVEDEVEEEFEERVAESGMHVRDSEVKTAGAGVELELNGNRSGDECGEGQNQDKKENEPFSVPTAGAFYMHDDRFREKGGGGRHRRTPGGSKLWESKDDRAWVHDRFEEMNLQDKYYDEERRTRKGHFRGRGKSRGQDRGYIRGNRSRGSDENGNQNRGLKGPRGRGARRYGLPQQKNNDPPPSQRNQFLKNPETTSTNNSGRTAAHTSSEHPEAFAPRKNVFASSLNSASPPFYPSRSSGQDISATQKRDSQSASANKRLSSYGPMEDNLSSTSHSNALLRGKTVVDADGLDRAYVNDSFHSVSGKPLANLKPINTTLSSQNRFQGGRNSTSSAPLSYQPASSHNQAGRGFAQTQLSAVSQRPAQPALRSSSQQLGQRLASGNQTSSPQGPSTTSSEVGDVESPPGSYKSKMSSAGKGKVGGIQGSGIAPFLYSGAQVTGASGAMGVAHGDQSMSGTPALLQVMQFGGQHHGGLGVPAVGMALPGYVAQPQLGFGNSEMTWLPMLAGAAAGALGAAYCSPYIALDGGYYGRPSGQPSSASVSSRETTSSKSSENVLKASQRPELVNDECGQRQNKPRRYSEMNFNQ